MVPLVLFYLLIIYSSAFQKIKKEVKAKNSLQQELWDASNAFESLLRQKSRASWLKEGDCNNNKNGTKIKTLRKIGKLNLFSIFFFYK